MKRKRTKKKVEPEKQWWIGPDGQSIKFFKYGLSFGTAYSDAAKRVVCGVREAPRTTGAEAELTGGSYPYIKGVARVRIDQITFFPVSIS